MNSNTDDRLVIKKDDKEYIIDAKLKNVLNNIMNDIDDIEIEKKVKIIKSILSIKFNLKLCDKNLNEIMYAMFDKNTIKDCVNANIKKATKKYYENNKQKYKDRYNANKDKIREYEKKRYLERNEKIKAYEQLTNEQKEREKQSVFKELIVE